MREQHATLVPRVRRIASRHIVDIDRRTIHRDPLAHQHVAQDVDVELRRVLHRQRLRVVASGERYRSRDVEHAAARPA
jgi:hypothetical protein